MNQHLDLYCERLDPSLFAEPINVISNFGYFVAAMMLWQGTRHRNNLPPGNLLLMCLVLLIGVGSVLFHVFATSLTRLMDVIPILSFMAVYVWLYSRRIINIPVALSGTLTIGFLISAIYSRQFSHIWNGLLIYLPALLVIMVFGTYHRLSGRRNRYDLIWASVGLLAALTLRSLDIALCKIFTTGTHFLWHVLSAFALYFALRRLMANTRADMPHTASGSRRLVSA
jgi:hypothetical protein